MSERSAVRVLIAPAVGHSQKAGGIPRVVEAQAKWLPQYDIEIVDRPEWADILAMHATHWIEPKPTQRVVSHCHGLYWSGYDWNSRWYSAVNYQVIEAMRQADVVTAPSQWVADVIKRGSNLSPLVIGHGVDTEEFVPSSGSSGYVYWDKFRVDPICDPRAVNILAKTLPNVKFVSTFGDEASNVTILGELAYEDNRRRMQQAGLYLATARETFGISVLEALACGVPVVGWDWAGQAEIFSVAGDKPIGYLARPGDYDDLARGIKQCLDNRQELSRNARAVAEAKFRWQDVVGRYATLYLALAQQAERQTVKVSVVMPSYNLKEYLPKAIESVVTQDYPEALFELIIVDDCSSDGSFEIATNIVKELGPSNVRVMHTPRNLYLAGALNYGIERAAGQYIVPLDADNLLAPGTIKTLADELDKHRELDIVYGKVKFVLEDGSPDGSVAGDGISGWPPREFNFDGQMAHRNQIPSTSMYRKAIWTRVDGYRSRCRTAEDADFWCRATSFGATARRVTDAVTLIYRDRQDSMSHVEKDWPWEAWYSWAAESKLTPWIASVHRENLPIWVTEPTVSIIIPVGPGHESQGLQDALDSVRSQTYKDWECIIVNDTGLESLPHTPSWVRTLSTPKRASGTSVARNIGLAAVNSRAEYVVFLDADDWLAPTFLEKTVARIKKTGGYIYTNWVKPDTQDEIQIPRFECKDQLQALRHAITCLYPIDPVKKNKLRFDESLKVGEDWDFVLAMQAAGYCGVHLDEALVYYRQSSGSNRKLLLQDIDSIRGQLQTKWSDKMGCGCSGNTPAVNNWDSQQGQLGQAVQFQALGGGTGEMVLVEFVAQDRPTTSWTGQATGTTYRFGSEIGNNVGYVHKSDAAQFLNRSEFRLADPESSSLASV